MVKQWVQPPINKNRLPPGGFLLGSHLTSVFHFLIKVFIGILGESFEIQFLARFYTNLIRDSIKFEIKLFFFGGGFHWNIRGKLRNPVLAIFYVDFNKGFNQIWNRVCFIFIIKVFIGILGESFEIQFLARFYTDFNKGFNQIWNQVVFIFIIKVFIGILGESFEIQFLARFYTDFNKGFNQIWNQVVLFLLLRFSLEY